MLVKHLQKLFQEEDMTETIQNILIFIVVSSNFRPQLYPLSSNVPLMVMVCGTDDLGSHLLVQRHQTKGPSHTCEAS